MPKFSAIICFIFILELSAIADSQQSDYFPKGIAFSIDRHPGWIGASEEGSDLQIRCTFRNESTNSLTFLLLTIPIFMGHCLSQ